MFHRHKWEEKAVVVAHPTGLREFDFSGMGRRKQAFSMIRKLTQGTTTYVLECDCGDMKKIECFGAVKS